MGGDSSKVHHLESVVSRRTTDVLPSIEKTTVKAVEAMGQLETKPARPDTGLQLASQASGNALNLLTAVGIASDTAVKIMEAVDKAAQAASTAPSTPTMAHSATSTSTTPTSTPTAPHSLVVADHALAGVGLALNSIGMAVSVSQLVDAFKSEGGPLNAIDEQIKELIDQKKGAEAHNRQSEVDECDKKIAELEKQRSTIIAQLTTRAMIATGSTAADAMGIAGTLTSCATLTQGTLVLDGILGVARTGFAGKALHDSIQQRKKIEVDIARVSEELGSAESEEDKISLRLQLTFLEQQWKDAVETGITSAAGIASGLSSTAAFTLIFLYTAGVSIGAAGLVAAGATAVGAAAIGLAITAYVLGRYTYRNRERIALFAKGAVIDAKIFFGKRELKAMEKELLALSKRDAAVIDHVESSVAAREAKISELDLEMVKNLKLYLEMRAKFLEKIQSLETSACKGCRRTALICHRQLAKLDAAHAAKLRQRKDIDTSELERAKKRFEAAKRWASADRSSRSKACSRQVDYLSKLEADSEDNRTKRAEAAVAARYGKTTEELRKAAAGV